MILCLLQWSGGSSLYLEQLLLYVLLHAR
jgi:hypothetical protein